MTTILLAALVCQFDQFEPEKQEIYHVDFNQIDSAPIKSETNIPVVSQEDLPVVDGYAPTWCAGCKLAVKECESLKDIIDIHWHTDSKEYPEAVKNLIANGGVYPVLWWTTPTGPRQISNGWKGVYDFTTRYDKTMLATIVPAKTASVTIAQPSRRYPVRGGWWDQDGHMVTWQHLTQGQHAGKFDHAWLQSLSYEEIQSLHSDDHEGRVHWQNVVRPGNVGVQPSVQQQYVAPAVQYVQPQRRVGPIRRMFGARG